MFKNPQWIELDIILMHRYINRVLKTPQISELTLAELESDYEKKYQVELYKASDRASGYDWAIQQKAKELLK